MIAGRPVHDFRSIHEHDPLWYKSAIIYELHVRAFYDSAGDGVGDFRGLTEKLDYLQDLGVTAIWILPFYPSPLRDDGYDIADYTGVNPAYGTLRDFRRFVNEAHRRDLRVITELVLNHTSDRHPWFQRARRSPPGSVWRDFYVWSDTPTKYADARIIFSDFETSNWAWDPVAGQYYWHRFYSHQPDLNFDNPAVHRALLQVMDSWFEMGVDGMRLDAVPYLYEREHTSCENLPETHAFLRKLRAHVDKRFPGRMLLAEANQWPEEAAAYFSEGDECHMAFHFPVMPRLFMSIQMEDRFPVLDILQQTPRIPDTCQWAMFLRNHDELTLEMVTDEERDYMYRVFATDQQARINLGIRRRLAPLMGNNRRKIELMKGLLFSLPGTPVIYYGDEIGMGDNIYLHDRDAVRTPMQWSPDRNAGFSRANPQRLYLPVILDPEYNFEAINVESQRNNPHSLLWWTKRLISLRRRHRAFGFGDIEFLTPDNPKILAFIRRSDEESILVVANLSRFVQAVELKLDQYRNHELVELFGGTRLPAVGDSPYFFTLGPHNFYWFALEPVRTGERRPPAERKPQVISYRGTWDRLFESDRFRRLLENLLITELPHKRWFASKSRLIRSVRIFEAAPFPTSAPVEFLRTFYVLIEVTYTEGEPDVYALPLALASHERVERVFGRAHSMQMLAQVHNIADDSTRWLYDASNDPALRDTLLDAIGSRRRFRGFNGDIRAARGSVFRHIMKDVREPLESALLKIEQTNSSIAYGDRFIIKLFRRIEPGVNPDLEIGRFLTERTPFDHAPAVAGSLEYASGSGPPRTLAILQQYIPNEGDGWNYALHHVTQFFERVSTSGSAHEDRELSIVHEPIWNLIDHVPSEFTIQLIGPFVQSAELIGERTAEMHRALASEQVDAAFAPERFTPMYQRSQYQSMRNLTRRTLVMLNRRKESLDDDLRNDAAYIISHEKTLLAAFQAILDWRISAMRIRCHGDYHLGQLLYTGRDFYIIDFEGEPTRPLGERRLKRVPLRDVAGMLRSFSYAANAVLLEHAERGVMPASIQQQQRLAAWARVWALWNGAAFLRSYLHHTRDTAFLPRSRDELTILLSAYVLEKMIYELSYELNSRPAWARIPLKDLVRVIHVLTASQPTQPLASD